MSPGAIDKDEHSLSPDMNSKGKLDAFIQTAGSKKHEVAWKENINVFTRVDVSVISHIQRNNGCENELAL